ncbi:unnamed protein product [Rhizoctonia solani]|uniref:F-box domain-containing protein n=1 Tax=Rhizoctonia solani TaxID=456999 RepID=A0A8H3HKI6_9AGAM|nr:unnamed protein product [Rhizoctonia solani]
MPINELPVEVLSRVFTLGEGMQRGPRAIGLPYVGFQDLAVQVCHRWREVAISTPELWIYIFISHPPPHSRAGLYVSRSGTLPLHIDLDMQKPFIKSIHPFQDTKQAERALEALDFIEKTGGKRDRWGSLVIFSKSLFTIISIYSFFTRSPTPALRFVSIKWTAHDHIVDIQEEICVEQFELSNPTLAHGSERPQIHHVEFNGLPKHFMFGSHVPLVSNLTRFTFICPKTMSLPSHEEFSAVLSASPRLEHLTVDMRAARSGYLEPEYEPADIASFQVQLPLLRSFSLDTSHLSRWSLHLLQIVDAPGVEYLDINTDSGSDLSHMPMDLYRYLARGRINGILQCYAPIDDNTQGSGPVFPRLKHLNVGRMTQNVQDILFVYCAFPLVTGATLGGLGLLALQEHPEYLPNASHFTYIDDETVDLPIMIEFANSRTEHKAISTLVWCVDRPKVLCILLDLEDGGTHPGADRHYHSLPELQVDHLIIRQIAQAPLYVADSDDEIYAFLGR